MDDSPRRLPLPFRHRGGWYSFDWFFTTYQWENSNSSVKQEYSFGVFLLYYSETFLSTYTLSQIGWIGSTAGFAHTTIGLLVGKLYDDGWVRYLVFTGSILHVFCLYMLSLCKTYWQVFLTQGLGFGIATGLIYQPALAIASQYFERRRAFATGIVMGGGAVGGIIFPIMVNNLIGKLGFQKAVLICASFMFVCLAIANIVLRPRIHYRSNQLAIGDDLELTGSSIQDRPLAEKYKINYKTFFNFPYAMAVLGCFFVYLVKLAICHFPTKLKLPGHHVSYSIHHHLRNNSRRNIYYITKLSPSNHLRRFCRWHSTLGLDRRPHRRKLTTSNFGALGDEIMLTTPE